MNNKETPKGKPKANKQPQTKSNAILDSPRDCHHPHSTPTSAAPRGWRACMWRIDWWINNSFVFLRKLFMCFRGSLRRWFLENAPWEIEDDENETSWPSKRWTPGNDTELADTWFFTFRKQFMCQQNNNQQSLYFSTRWPVDLKLFSPFRVADPKRLGRTSRGQQMRTWSYCAL